MGRPRKDNSPIGSFFRSIFTVIVLSSFVLGISFFVKALFTSDSRKLMTFLTPVLIQLHVDPQNVSEVAGAWVSRISTTTPTENNTISTVSAEIAGNTDTPQLDFVVAVMADTHDKYDKLNSALSMASAKSVTDVFFLGDFSSLGEVASLESAKKTMDASGLEYYALPGDHDLYNSVGPQNFVQIFGRTHFSKTINDVKFVGLDNSANFTLINDDIMSWFQNEVATADFVLLSQPLYHPNLNVVMGVVQGEVNSAVKNQADTLLTIIRNSHAKAIIAGDQHMSSKNADVQKPALSHIVVGALTDERNLQTPRFSYLYVYKDGSYKIEDVLLE